MIIATCKLNSKIQSCIQAYDSVWREALYHKLESCGFGDRTLDLIKSLYCNDSLKFLLNGQYSSDLWLTRGVKQGKNQNYDKQINPSIFRV